MPTYFIVKDYPAYHLGLPRIPLEPGEIELAHRPAPDRRDTCRTCSIQLTQVKVIKTCPRCKGVFYYVSDSSPQRRTRAGC